MDRTKIHKPYYKIKGYMVLRQITKEDIAKALGIHVRTYQDKVSGYSDFSLSEAATLAELLQVTVDDIRATN